MKRKIVVLCLALCCALLLFGCASTEAVKSEQEILADLQEKGMPEENPDAEITSLEILKRQTNEKDKQDLVYVTIQAETETVQYVRSYQVEYGLYDSGWVLDSVSRFEDGENKAIPLTEPGDELIDAFFREFNAGVEAHNAEYANESKKYTISNPPYSSWEITQRDVDLESGTATLYGTASRETPFLITHEAFAVPIGFDETYGIWNIMKIDVSTVTDAIQSIQLDWSKVSSVTLKPKLDSYSASINSIDRENRLIDIDCWCGQSYSGTYSLEDKYDLSDYQSCRTQINREIEEENAGIRNDERFYGRYVGDNFSPVASTSLYFLAVSVGYFNPNVSVGNYNESNISINFNTGDDRGIYLTSYVIEVGSASGLSKSVRRSAYLEAEDYI